VAAKTTGVPISAGLLIVAAMGIAALGGVLVSTATSAVALIAWACLLAIFARIAQATTHHREVMAALTRMRGDA
jgi:hypothetical protein